ncbi:hypothetical protein JW911_01855 [Candidatus Peregrinibacteria bacterium]|nr:hypothetical protein [Candidatus Peregrinibacteria bacterium]
MADQNEAELVTLEEAVNKVKKWTDEKDWQNAKEGCEEILAVDPQNKEILDILDNVNKNLGQKETTDEIPAFNLNMQAKQEPAPAPEVKQTTPPPPTTTLPQEEKAEKKSSNTGIIITAIIFILILGGLVALFLMGWLNPFYNWLLGLFGL